MHHGIPKQEEKEGENGTNQRAGGQGCCVGAGEKLDGFRRFLLNVADPGDVW